MSTSLNSVANVDEQGAETTVSATAGSERGSVLSTHAGNVMHRNDMHIDVIKNFQDFSKAREQLDSVYYADPEAQFFLSWT